MMLYQPVHRPSRQRLMVAAGLLVTVWLLWNGAFVFVAVIGLAWLGIHVRRRRRADALRDAGLLARAEFEHRLNLGGDPRGIYGRYPPVQPGWFPDPRNHSQLRYFDGGS